MSDKQLEWIGGRFPAPVAVTGGDVPYRPELTLWLEAGGPIVGMEMAPPGDRYAPTLAAFRKSMVQPLQGRPRRPSRVRTADPELAAALRAEGHKDIQVIVEPTPELDALLEDMRSHFAQAEEEEEAPGYLDGGDVSPEHLAAFFSTAARLYRAEPWLAVPSDESLLTVEIEALGVHGHVVSIIGALGENRGLLLFRSRADFEQFIFEAERSQRSGGVPELPPQLALNFEPVSSVPALMHREATTHGWEIADDDGFPLVMAVRGLVSHRPTPKELATIEAISNALATLREENANLAEVWDSGDGLDRTIRVAAGGQLVDLRFTVPARSLPTTPRPGHFDIHAEKRDGDQIDEAWVEEFEAELLQRFLTSPEGQSLSPRPGWISSVAEFARVSLAVTVARIGAAELRHILFELIPRKISCDPKNAPEIVTELRAFWTWAKREFQLPTADECLAVLRPGAEKALALELANPDKFGMAKSLVMSGMAAGYDMTSQQGLDQWMADLNARKVPFPKLPDLDHLVPKATLPGLTTAQKEKRKAQRAARKRNR